VLAARRDVARDFVKRSSEVLASTREICILNASASRVAEQSARQPSPDPTAVPNRCGSKLAENKPKRAQSRIAANAASTLVLDADAVRTVLPSHVASANRTATT
jgi:hypothetical protein